MMRSSRWDEEIESSAVYGHMLTLVGLLLHQPLEGKLGKPVLQTNDMIGGKRGAKKGGERIVAVLKTRKEFCLVPPQACSARCYHESCALVLPC